MYFWDEKAYAYTLIQGIGYQCTKFYQNWSPHLSMKEYQMDIHFPIVTFLMSFIIYWQ